MRTASEFAAELAADLEASRPRCNADLDGICGRPAAHYMATCVHGHTETEWLCPKHVAEGRAEMEAGDAIMFVCHHRVVSIVGEA